jgi:hypothetical protein
MFDKKYILIIFCVNLAIMILIQSRLALETTNLCQLPKDECQLIKPYEINNRYPYIIKCILPNSGFDIGSKMVANETQKCEMYKNEDFYIMYNPENPLSTYILDVDKNFNFENLKNYLKIFGYKRKITIKFTRLDGFEVNRLHMNQPKFDVFLNNSIELEFYKSKFEFFIDSKRIESCEDLLLSNSNMTSTYRSGLPFLGTKGIFAYLKRCDFRRKVCPLVLDNSELRGLYIEYMVKSFIKTNVLRFYDMEKLKSNRQLSFRTRIYNLIVNKIENIEFDNGLLNRHVFASSLRVLVIEGNDFWIHPEVFKNFKKLKIIDIYNKKKGFIRGKNIKWTKYINADVNVSLDEVILKNRPPPQNELIHAEACIITYTLSEYPVKINLFYPDEDFCLYINIPFHRLVILKDDILMPDYYKGTYFEHGMTCTLLWLIQFYPIYIKYFNVHIAFGKLDKEFFDLEVVKKLANLEVEIEKCNFPKRLNNCISNYRPSDEPFFRNEDYEINISYAQMIFIFLIPVVCACGIVSSVLVIRTIPLIKKDKELKDKRHYDYMRINAATNCFLFLIKIIGLINECTAEFWCSQINRLVGVQYYKLIFGEMLATSLRFFSNFTYVAFLLCRLSLIGKEHGRLVEKVSNQMSIKRFVSYYACLSLVLSIVKYFRFQINDADIFKYEFGTLDFSTFDEYPAKFSRLDNFFDDIDNPTKSNLLNNIRAVTWAFIVLNCISDILNYPVFLIICLVLDIVTSVELRKTLSQKISTSKQIEEEKEEAIFKSTLLAILNALCNFLLKLPMTVNSIFEIYISLNYKITNYSKEFFNKHFFYFLIDLNGGDLFENLANFLYFFSLSLNFVFYYNFDRMFRFYFRKWFFNEKTSTPSSERA